MQLSEKIGEYYWWHTIDLGGGVVTNGAKTLEAMRVEAEILFSRVDLKGKSLLDVGAWNGGFTVEAMRRGADRLAGLDHATWNNPALKGRETFDLVSKAFGDRFEAFDVDLDKPALDLQPLGQFDVVLYSGVFYHLVDPIAATREVCRLARETLILETHVEHTADARPQMIFYPGAELSNDASNWWGPNVACVVELLKLFGFPRVEISDGGNEVRKVFHAWR